MVGRRIRRPRSMLLPYLYPVQLAALPARRHRVRPEPGPNTQNKPRELDPKGSHGLLCTHLRRKRREGVGDYPENADTSDGITGKVSEVGRKTQGPQTELLGKRRRFRNVSIHLLSQQPGMRNLGPRQSASQCIYDGFAWLKVDSI